MRRMSLVLIAVGAFLIVLAPMIRFYAYPRLAVAPANQISITGLQAKNATVFSIVKLKEYTTDLNIEVTTHGDATTPEKHPNDVTYVNSTLTKDADGNLLSGEVERMSFDKRTGEASDCCNDFVSDVKDDPDGTAVVHQGLVAKFPFNAQKKTYMFWDSTLRKALPIEYLGTSKVEGMTVYEYAQTIPPTAYNVQETPLSLLGLPGTGNVDAQMVYSTKRTLLVEPETGVIIKRTEAQLSTLDYQGQPRLTLTDAVVTYDDKTVRKNIDDYGSQGSRLHLTRTTGPQIAFVLGLVMMIAGVVIGRRKENAGGHRVHNQEHAHA